VSVPEKISIYETTYRNYLKQVAEQEFTQKEDALGVRISGDDVIVPFFGKDFQVNSAGILDDHGRPPHFAVSVVLCKYLIHYKPDILCAENDSQWVSYRNFKDAAPLVNYFSNTSGKSIAKNFTGSVKRLEASCRTLGGELHDEGLSYDLTMQVTPLPHVPLYLLFNDADDEFGAECSVLFEKRVEKFLDMECVAIVGALFADYLIRPSGKRPATII